MSTASLKRCTWCGDDPQYVAYHDEEWGTPSHDDRHLFEMLCLEGAQAGLAWITILRKREGYRKAFSGFDAEKVARYTDREIDSIVADPGVVRHRGKLESVVKNARAFLAVQSEFGSFDRYLWRFVDGEPVINAWVRDQDAPASTPVSTALSKDLKKRGFGFVGPTTCYAYMQSVGLVDDHIVGCFRHSGGG